MKKSHLIAPLLSILLACCQSPSSGQYDYQPPLLLDDGIQVGTLLEAGIEPGPIEEAVARIGAGRYGEIHSLLLYKDGKLILEEYFPGHLYRWDAPGHHDRWVNWDRSMLHGGMSTTKSVTSACIGIAIDRGFIENVHRSIFDYLPEHRRLGTGGKEKITIEHLLTMTSGLAWDEWGAPLSSAENDAIGIWFNQGDDPLSFVLERPLLYEPGAHFTYSGGDMQALGEILRHASGMRIDEFAEKYLFEPLQIDSVAWTIEFHNGMLDAASSLQISPRGMLKFGITYLQQGVWNDTRILSEHWVQKSAVPYRGNTNIRMPGEDIRKVGYGYTWWTKRLTVRGKPIDLFWANGWGGQKIIVMPGLNAVVVFTGGNYLSKVKEFKVLEKYILPAIEKKQ